MEKNGQYDEFRRQCRLHNCKCTPQRMAVYDVLHNNHSHPDVNQIWNQVRKKLPSITRESVFRILGEFAEFGIVNRMDKIVNARFDGQAADHGHLICEKCGFISDFELPAITAALHTPPDFITRHIEL